MDPHWKDCPYCRSQEQRSSRASSAAEAPEAPHRSTIVSQRVDAGDVGRETRAMVMPAPAAPSRVQDERPIVGILVTFSHRPEGQLFALRVGRNFIGAGRIGTEPGERLCDVHVPNDQMMSSEHALILCRHGHHHFYDQKSSNGSFVNGKLVESGDLTNYAEIRTGSTVWTFIQIAAPQGMVAQAPTSETVTSARSQPVEGGTVIQAPRERIP